MASSDDREGGRADLGRGYSERGVVGKGLKLADDILAAVEAGFDAQIAYTQDLIRFPSLRGQEQTAQDFVFDSLADRGYAMDRRAINVADIEAHPGFSPVKVDYSNAINVVGMPAPTYRAEAAIIPEPEDNMLVRANVGVLWFRVHMREAGTGANAIEAAFPIISALRPAGGEMESGQDRTQVLRGTRSSH